MPIQIQNHTHWRSTDIKRLVQGAIDAAGVEQTDEQDVSIKYASIITVLVSAWGVINIGLPKRGTKSPHPNAMVALATAGVESNTTLLAFQDVFWLANFLAWKLSSDGNGTGANLLSQQRRSINPPSWGRDLYIAKYADPLKDASFVAFAERKEKEIATAQGRVDKWDAEQRRVDKNLTRAKRDLAAAKKSLKDAKKRRTA